MYLAKKFPPSSKFEGANKLFSVEEEKKKMKIPTFFTTDNKIHLTGVFSIYSPTWIIAWELERLFRHNGTEIKFYR